MKTLTGLITSTKMNQTARVQVATLWQHPLYQKRVKRSKNYLVHNAIDAKEGNTVVIQESRPLSKLKRWVITKIISK